MGKKGFEKSIARLSVVTALLLSLAPSSLAADYDSVCGKVTDTLPGTEVPHPKKQYCDAAKSAQEAAKTDAVLWKVWAGVAATCIPACATSTVGPAGSYVCMGASAAGAVTDGVMTKNFASAMMGIVGTGMTYMMKPQAPAAGTSTSTETSKGYTGNVGACLTAATAAMQAFTKNQSMKSQEDTAKSNLEIAEKTNATAGSSVSTITHINGAGTGGNSGSAGSSSSGTGSTGTASTAPTSPNGAICSQAANTNSVQATLQCAVASDRTLPSFVATPGFLKDFRKAAGYDFQEFLNRNDPPARALASSMSGTLSSEQAGQLGAALKALGEKMDSPVAGPSYAGGGGGAPSAGGGSDASINDALSGFLNQLQGGGEQKDRAPAGMTELDYQALTRPAAAIERDKSLSIFSRISFRYYNVGSRVLPVESPATP